MQTFLNSQHLDINTFVQIYEYKLKLFNLETPK